MCEANGTMHLWLRGVMDCESMYNTIATLVGPDIGARLALLAIGRRKSLFQQGIWMCEADKVSVYIKPEEVSKDTEELRELLRATNCNTHVNNCSSQLAHGAIKYASFYVGPFILRVKCDLPYVERFDLKRLTNPIEPNFPFPLRSRLVV